jgi:hypothetical protein
MPVTLDFSKAQPLPQPVTLDFSKAQPIDQAPTDSRNFIQKKLDSLSTVSPEERSKGTPAQNYMNDFAAGTIGAIVQPISHPLDAITGAAHAVMHPVDTAKAMIQSAKDNPAQFGGNVGGGILLGEAAAPIAEAVGSGIGRAASAAKVPQRLYESALKPSTTLSTAERSAITQTGLKNGILVSPEGAEKIGDLVNDYNTKIANTIASDPTRKISTAPAMRNLQSVRSKFTNQVAPSGDLQQIDAAGKEFASQTPTGSMNASDAQAMKQGTYRALGSKSYGEVKGASIEAQKALARGLKEEIATQFPEIGDMNAAESKLLDLQPVLERAVNRNANHQLIGIGSPIAGAAAKAATGSGPAALATMLIKSVIDDPMVKSRLAISLSKGAKIPISQAAARVQAYSAALGSIAAGAQGYSPDAPVGQ